MAHTESGRIAGIDPVIIPTVDPSALDLINHEYSPKSIVNRDAVIGATPGAFHKHMQPNFFPPLNSTHRCSRRRQLFQSPTISC